MLICFVIIKSTVIVSGQSVVSVIVGISVSAVQPESFTLCIFVIRSDKPNGDTENP